MLSTTCLAVLALAAIAAATPVPAGPHNYKICVPEVYFSACKEMENQEGLRLKCVEARDRLDCLEKVGHHQADIMAADPEDMYLATTTDVPFTVFKEIRTTEEPGEEFRYEAVAVVHKDLDISSVQGLRGLRSCHTGVGRNVGYKIPITKLTQLGVLPQAVADAEAQDLTAREVELGALSQLFSKACLVGQWSSDATVDRRLKSQYHNLCELCENPNVCDYPDRFSGYDGALRCLSDNGGQVAWTKVYYVKKHFGIPLGGTYKVVNATKYDPTEYAYLCPDGTKRPVQGPACRWAARPWQGFIANGDISSDVDDLRAQLSLAAQQGATSDARWLTQVLTLIKDKTAVVDAPQPPISPQEYLDKANYTDVITRASGGAPVRLCVRSQAELSKCAALRSAAYSRDVRPRIACVLKEGDDKACVRAVAQGDADVVTVDGVAARQAHTEFGLNAALIEVYGDRGIRSAPYAVAVVRKESTITSWEDLRGKRSCHSAFDTEAGWIAPLAALKTKGLLGSDTCPSAQELSNFFSGGSCVPGAPSAPSSLCSLCSGGQCGLEAPYASDEGAFRCLVEGAGDVAFLLHGTVYQNSDGNGYADWAESVKSEDYELLCPDGGRKPVTEAASCNLAELSPRQVMARGNATQIQVDAIRHLVTAVGDLYSKRRDLFLLFGPYDGHNDLLFTNVACGFKTSGDPGFAEAVSQGSSENLRAVVSNCGRA